MSYQPSQQVNPSYESWPWANDSSGSSCVEINRDRSLADRNTAKQTRLSSRCCKCRQTVRRRTGWASDWALLNLSTQNHVQYVRPDAGGNARSPTHREFDPTRHVMGRFRKKRSFEAFDSLLLTNEAANIQSHTKHQHLTHTNWSQIIKKTNKNPSQKSIVHL